MTDTAQAPQRLVRTAVPDLDAILGQAFRVLDDGFVRVIDYLGDDRAIVQAARVSYGAGTKRAQDDRALIRYLLRHSHTTPFEMCELKLHVRVPMDTWRQWVRHRTANINEYSTRYSVAIDSAQKTDPDEWRLQSQNNKQGSSFGAGVAVGERLSREEAEYHKASRKLYEDRIAAGIAREQARKDLPLSTYTEAYWKIDLHNLLHFLALRMDEHAQQEIRAYATAIGHEIVARWVPHTWEAFLDYGKNALNLSNIEIEVVAAMVRGDRQAAAEVATKSGLLARDVNGTLKPNRERTDLEFKLRRLGLPSLT